ncbi:20883_t:CDS:1, partial [Cetraspora pellucida]
EDPCYDGWIYQYGNDNVEKSAEISNFGRWPFIRCRREPR